MGVNLRLLHVPLGGKNSRGAADRGGGGIIIVTQRSPKASSTTLMTARVQPRGGEKQGVGPHGARHHKARQRQERHGDRGGEDEEEAPMEVWQAAPGQWRRYAVSALCLQQQGLLRHVKAARKHVRPVHLWF
jgi:hypothetical protein